MSGVNKLKPLTLALARKAAMRMGLTDCSPAGRGNLLVFGRGSDGCLSCCQAGYRDSERAARDVVQAQLVAEVDRVGVSPMLSADSDLHLRTRLAAFGDRDRHQPPDSALVDRLERVARKDLVLQVPHDEVPLGIVARVAERHLSQVVGAEGEEFRDGCDLAR